MPHAIPCCMHARPRARSLVRFCPAVIAGCAASSHAQVVEFFDHAAFAAASGSNIRVIGFDDRPAGDGVLTGNEYASLGMTMIQRSDWPMNLVTAADIAAGGGAGATGTGSINSPATALSSSFMHLALDPNRDDQYDITLTCGTHAAGLYLGNVGPGQTIVQFRTTGDIVLAAELIDAAHAGTIPGPSANDNRLFYGVTSATDPITSIRVQRVNSNPDPIVLDDLQWAIGPLTVSQQPQSATACQGGSAVFTAAAAGSVTYQWQFQDGGLWLNIPEGGDITLGAGTPAAEFFGHSQGSTHGELAISSIFSPRDHPSGLPLRCIISDTCTGATTDTATLTACYANCDCSTTSPALNVLDFGCFLNKFAAGSPDANCDGSSSPPILNVLDFGCFLNKFAAGCP